MCRKLSSIQTQTMNISIGLIRPRDKPVSTSEVKGSLRGRPVRMADDLDRRIRIVLNRMRG